MIRYDEHELDEILEAHKKWLLCIKGGVRADLRRTDLSNADLRGANLSSADLSYADLRGANLSCANLRYTDLSHADLSNAYLEEANLSCANLRYTDLSHADLSNTYLIEADLGYANLLYTDLNYADLNNAYLSHANLRGANLSYVNLRGANLSYVNLTSSDLSGADLMHANLVYTNLKTSKYSCRNIPFIPMACPEEGSFIGYKKASDMIVKLEILSDSKRSSAFSRKCRCDKARVIEIQTLSGDRIDINRVESSYDKTFVYTVGEVVKVDNFDGDRFNECSPGIHFFINRQEAVDY